MIYEINLKNDLNNDLSMRYLAEDLFDNLPSTNKIKMNFKDITFMSRAFAQEYVYQKENHDVEIIEENMDENVQKMFEVVYKFRK
ncbi:MAG: hypothetical protein LBM96_12325 [Methanobrevibacter sp.]|jgi:hypothetical protein|nr:hypothetical protein [Candidatus Methanoflexus mossambicus]